MQMQSILAILMIIIFIYFICKQYYLNRSEFMLLLSALLMLSSLLLPQWMTYIAYLVFMSWHSIIILTSAKQTYYFDMRASSIEYSKCVEIFFRIKQQQIILIFYGMVIWIWIRITSLQNQKSSFLQYLNGWNCTLEQLWLINLICFIFCLLSLYSCHFIIKYQTDKNHLYKQYLLKYKIYYDALICFIVTIYNYHAYSNAHKLSQCLSYYQHGLFFRIIWFWGYPITTLLFIYKKHGLFLLQVHSEKAQKQNNLDQQLNQKQIMREYSQKSEGFLH